MAGASMSAPGRYRLRQFPKDPTPAAHRPVACAPHRCSLWSVLADSLDEPLRQRTLVARELIHAGAQVRTQLPSRIGGIADFSELVEGVTVIIEKRRREEFSGALRGHACRRGEPTRPIGQRTYGRDRHHG